MIVENVNNINLSNYLTKNGITYKHMISDSLEYITNVNIEFHENTDIEKVNEVIEKYKESISADIDNIV